MIAKQTKSEKAGMVESKRQGTKSGRERYVGAKLGNLIGRNLGEADSGRNASLLKLHRNLRVRYNEVVAQLISSNP